MSTWAIGDIQGCYLTLRALLKEINFDPQTDRLWLVGDLVNRGPGSLETLRYLRELGDAVTAVLGNHDLYLLMVAEGVERRRGRDDTIDPILFAPDRRELLDWLRHRPLCHLEGDYCMVHAGLLPGWTVPAARALAAEVEALLRGPDWREALGAMWGSEPAAWDDGLQGWDRMRVIVNAMTRMRFCSPGGILEFHAKGPPETAPAGFLPWFRCAETMRSDYTLVVGHWSALGLVTAPGLLALDTGCLWGGALSAICLESRQVVQVRCQPGDGSAKRPR